jgi:hypothetical protein
MFLNLKVIEFPDNRKEKILTLFYVSSGISPIPELRSVDNRNYPDENRNSARGFCPTHFLIEAPESLVLIIPAVQR